METVRKCSCGEGSQQVLDTLRSTTLANMAIDDFNEIVDDVNMAGGVQKVSGLSRVLIEKALRDLREGVAKGDYVGHPFRGNQHTDSSGAGRGAAGAAGGPKSSAGRRANASQQQLDALNERLAGEDRSVLFQGVLDIARGDAMASAAAEKGLKMLERAKKYGINTEAGQDALQDARDAFEEENVHHLAEAVDNVMRAKPSKSEQEQINEAKREKQFQDAKRQAARQAAAEEERRKTLVPVNEDNIDKPLKGEEAASFKADRKVAVAALKDTFKIIEQMQAKAQSLPSSKRSEANTLLTQAVEAAGRYSSLLNDSSKATIRSAVAISAIGTDLGEEIKGYLYDVDDLITGGAGKGGYALARMSAIQSASDKNFGVPYDKYDTAGAFDFIGR